MAAANILDRESFKAWLADKPRELCVLMAARAALRALPLFSRFAVEPKEPRQFAELTGSLFRATALARVAAVYPARANDFADAAAAYAADADAWAAIREDAANFERGGLIGLISTPLWPTEQPPWSVEAWSTLRAALPNGENWEVWTV